MMKIWVCFVLPLIIIGCAGQGAIEFGINDGALFDGTLGDISMTVTRIEMPEGDLYTTVWEGAKEVIVGIQVSDFVSITDRYIEVTPGSYQNIRLTVESVRYIQDSNSVLLIDTSYQFIATAFSALPVEENFDQEFVVGIMSTTWFDIDSLKIREGYEAFQGASLKINY
ncbi:MAG: hypothetical protein WBB67_10985 [bacterium]